MLRSSYESVPEQLVSLPKQLVSLPEQLCLPKQLEVFWSSLESVPEQFRKCSGAVTKVFRSS